MAKKHKLKQLEATSPAPAGYGALLNDLKARIRAAQVKAALSVNRELIALYWHIGGSIVARQRAEGWGKAVVERLASDLEDAFPGLNGFSSRNIWYARSFYLAYEPERPKLKQVVSESDRSKLAQPARELERAILPQAVSGIPWGHNIVLLQKVKDPAIRLWYARQTVANGWSRAMLTHWIESGLHARQGKAVTNFKTVLPAPQSDLVAEIIRDPYNFDFLTLRTDAAERDLERGLLDHIRKFLLELGAGFAFVGQQVHLEVDDEDFYLSAVDDLLRHPDDKPSIGLILCKTRSKVIAEYALRDLAKPVGVARYKTRLIESLPDHLQGELPTIERIRAELAGPERPQTKRSTKKQAQRGQRKGKT